jgi:hypothetical protein
MEEIKITWQLLTLIGAFCGVIVALVKYHQNKIHDSVDKLVEKTNVNTKDIAVESERNDHQDDRLDKHDGEINTLKDHLFQVKYKRA